jgi:hypothetical protein
MKENLLHESSLKRDTAFQAETVEKFGDGKREIQIISKWRPDRKQFGLLSPKEQRCKGK